MGGEFQGSFVNLPRRGQRQSVAREDTFPFLDLKIGPAYKPLILQFYSRFTQVAMAGFEPATFRL